MEHHRKPPKDIDSIPDADQPEINWGERYLKQEVSRAAAMAPEHAVTAEHVRDTILRGFNRRTGQKTEWHVERVCKGRESWLFKAGSPLAPNPLAIKVYCTAVKPRLVQRQLSALQRYHAGMASQPELTVPQGWAAYAKHRSLIMEWIDEPRVDKLLRNVEGVERDRIIAAAGRWLRHFHEQGEPELRPFDTSRLVRSVDTPLGGEGAGASVKDPAFRRAYATFRRYEQEFAGRPVRYAVVHGDFKTANLFHGPRRTVGFDFSASRAGPVIRDIFHFVASAEVDGSLARRGSTLLRSGRDLYDLNAFMAGYGPLDEQTDERLLAFCRLAEALNSWVLVLGGVRRHGLQVRRIARALRLRHMARASADFLEQA